MCVNGKAKKHAVLHCVKGIPSACGERVVGVWTQICRSLWTRHGIGRRERTLSCLPAVARLCTPAASAIPVCFPVQRNFLGIKLLKSLSAPTKQVFLA